MEEDEFLSVTVQVLLPSSIFIDTFLTYLPLFSQHYGQLAGRVSFNRLGIEGTNNVISCGVSNPTALDRPFQALTSHPESCW